MPALGGPGQSHGALGPPAVFRISPPGCPQVSDARQLRVGQYVVLILSDKGGSLTRYL